MLLRSGECVTDFLVQAAAFSMELMFRFIVEFQYVTGFFTKARQGNS
jgi:hypothetical protein